MIREDEYQLKISNEIIQHFNNGVQNIVLEAPTGSGKSGIAWFVHKLSKLTTCVLSHQKVLQDQYQNLLNDNDIITLKGKSNYTCPKFNNNAADLSPCSFLRSYPCEFKFRNNCPYFKTRKKAATATFLNSNYQQIFSIFDSCENFDLRKELYIFDECHNLYDIYTDFRTVKIGAIDLKFYQTLAKFASEERFDDLEYIARNAQKLYKNINFEQLNTDNEYFLELFKKIFKIKSNVIDYLTDQVEKNSEELIISGKIKQVGLFSNFENKGLLKYLIIESHKDKIIDNNNFVVESVFNKVDDFEIKLIPLDISSIFRVEANSFSDKKLFMSSTIFGGDRLLNELGLNDQKNAVIYLDSRFPVENRRIYSIPLKNLNNKIINSPDKSELDEYFKSLTQLIIEHAKKKESGVIFTSSYKFTSMIVDRIKDEIRKNNIELIYNEKSENRDEALVKFCDLENKNPKVLISPSFFEGVNFSENISRYQIIAKIPFKSLASKYVKTKMEKDNLSYSISALKLIVQAAGRSVRSETDYANTYILDGNWQRIHSSCKKYIPKWFEEAIINI